MAAEVFFDTGGFFALIDTLDPFHSRAVDWITAQQGRRRLVTTEWIVVETWTLVLT